ncbi:MAG: MerR family transcriptional regulator [Chitinophagaceae bacterium]|nr:MerR family transcriptional regulator [Chitinophagaceae bacterium]
MQTHIMIPVQEFCMHHQVDPSFIYSLKESGLIDISIVEETSCIPADQLPGLEKITRLYEMDINLEGIETITYLLGQINKQEEKIRMLTNRLSRFESDELT